MYNIFLFETYNSQDVFKKGQEFTQKIKTADKDKKEYSHLPCYNYVYLFIKQYITNLNANILNDFKMAYKKNINELKTQELYTLTYNSLKVPSEPATMRGIEYANSKYKMGSIVSPDQAKVGDVISFWVYQFVEFSQKTKDYSYKDTETKFNEYLTKNKIDKTKLPEWLIEGIVLKYGHYAVVSDVDSKYLYLSSSGEKNGVNGIWNGVSRSECSDNFTKVLKDDLKKFQSMSYEDFIFKSSDQLSQGRTTLILRSYILNFIR